ncbi:MAG: alpha/beta hydrolase [Ktedonobacteraceae bacterium]|nr:alpha/beta hydrolase [Ktedonobacteraceae bacterium]
MPAIRKSLPATMAAGSLAAMSGLAALTIRLYRHPRETVNNVVRGGMLLAGAREATCHVDGLPVRYYSVGQRGDPLVLVHGLGGSAGNWAFMLPYLSREYRVYALDMPGFGQTPLAPEGAGVRTHVHYLKRFIEIMGWPRIILAGHSLGGWITARYAAENPERVQRLYLVNSAGLHRDGMRSPFTPDRESARRYIHGMLEHRLPVPDFILDAMVHNSRRPAFVGFIKSYDPDDGLDDLLPQIQAPTTIFWGERDRILPASCAGDFLRSIPNARLIRIPSAGHMPNVTAAGELARVMLDDAIY